eukprot:12263127-Alexandrium_andersonii.AAC.1
MCIRDSLEPEQCGLQGADRADPVGSQSSATARCVSSRAMPLHWARRWRHSSRPRRAPIAQESAETSAALA